MLTPTPYQSELLAKNRRVNRAHAHTTKKRSYRRLVGMLFGLTGAAAAAAGMPTAVTFVLWLIGAGAWVLLGAL